MRSLTMPWFVRLLSALTAVVLVGCSSDGGSSSATTAESRATTTSSPISVPTACDTYPPDVSPPGDFLGFEDLVTESDSLESFTVESVSWRVDTSVAVAFEVGAIIFTGKDDNNRDVRLQIPTSCAHAAELAGAMPVGSKLTVLLQQANYIQVEAGFVEPKIVTAWYGDDWSRPAYPPIWGLDKFEQLASSKGKTPFALIVEMLHT